MRLDRIAVVFSLFLPVFGCSDDGGDTGGGTDESTSATDTTMTLSSTSEDGSSDDSASVTATVSATEDSSSGDPTATATDPDSSSGSSDSGGSTDTGTENLCMPDADDDECYVCGKENCCAEFMACAEADPGCPCVLECLAALDAPGPTEAMTCSDECNADFISLAPSLMNITQCQIDNCDNECGL